MKTLAALFLIACAPVHQEVLVSPGPGDTLTIRPAHHHVDRAVMQTMAIVGLGLTEFALGTFTGTAISCHPFDSTTCKTALGVTGGAFIIGLPLTLIPAFIYAFSKGEL
jgi:hypothetical protein